MASEQDSRFTWFGIILHRSSLHLLPRLWNVLNGDLYLIGVSPLIRELMVTNFSKQLLNKEYKAVADLYDISEGKSFSKLIESCIPIGLITYADLHAYKLFFRSATVIKQLDTRPRLMEEAEYFLSARFPSLRLFIMFIGKFFVRLLTAVNLLRLKESKS